MGSGSTGKAAVLEGFSFIGIEREAEYLVIAQARNVILIPQFGGIKQVVAEETDKENKPAVICLPPLGEYLDNLGRPASEYIFSGEQKFRWLPVLRRGRCSLNLLGGCCYTY